MPHYFVKESFIADEYCKDMMTDPNSFEIESEELDPRVQEELEKLNNCTITLSPPQQPFRCVHLDNCITALCMLHVGQHSTITLPTIILVAK